MVKINNKILWFLGILFIFLALFFNLNNFIGFFYNALWNYNYNREDYKNALNYHKKAENKIKNNTINYNLGWDYYKLWDYTKAREYYEKIHTGTWKTEDLKMDYNLWNAFYKLWEIDPNIENKINLRKQSTWSYKNILDQKEDKKTRQNYDFVMKKLKSLEDNKEKQENQEEQQKDEANKDEKNSQESQDWQEKEGKNEQSQDKKESENNSWEKKQDKNVTKENKSWQGNHYDIKKDSKLKELTEDEKRQLEEYNEQLKEQQKQNSKSFWKKSNSNQEDIFDIFNQDPFFGNYENFDNSILNGNEKDW